MNVGVVDIGTNSIRLLITDGSNEVGRWVEVTGLGRGVDRTGVLDDKAIKDTLEVFARFGALMTDHRVARRSAIATSASRDAANRESFFDRAEGALGVRPELISGEREGRLAFSGALSGGSFSGPIVVSDIGGGSTEFVTDNDVRSVDIGSVRLTERHLRERPPTKEQLSHSMIEIARQFGDIEVGPVETHIGVAGTWTSLAAISQDLEVYDSQRVHGHTLTNAALDAVVEKLRGLTVEETAAIPSLDSARAPVILAGATVATVVTEVLGVPETFVSEHDTLDGVASELLAIL